MIRKVYEKPIVLKRSALPAIVATIGSFVPSPPPQSPPPPPSPPPP